MNKSEAFTALGRILRGYYPSISIELTRECPLRCPGCYAYEPDHLGEAGSLRSLADFEGQELIDGVLELVHRYRPLHVSIVGGEPLVRFRELDILLPRLSEMGLNVQLVTSAVRQIPLAWSSISKLHLAVSVDGLQPEHDARRNPATYQRILKNIEGHRITVHCTVTRQMVGQEGYFEKFLSFWSVRPEVKKIWFSLFTPQVGAAGEEILLPEDRTQVLAELVRLRRAFPKVYLPDLVIEGFRKPPQSPAQCIFARTTLNFTADLKSRITPCQFGGEPDCKQCGCFASAGLTAVGDHRLLGLLPARALYDASDAMGKMTARIFGRQVP
jgi:organic radical activating enzyme